ncbi:unnamed protein product [Amaranthus hypochondriacus]
MEDNFEFPTSSVVVEEDVMEMENNDDVVDEILVLKVGEEKEVAKNGMKKKLIVEGEGWPVGRSLLLGEARNFGYSLERRVHKEMKERRGKLEACFKITAT